MRLATVQSGTVSTDLTETVRLQMSFAAKSQQCATAAQAPDQEATRSRPG